MKYTPTEHDEIARAFKQPASAEKGIPEWRIFDAVRGDRVEMYVARKLRGSARNAPHSIPDEFPEDAYL